MVEDGLMERFAIQEVYGMHNMPGLPVGQFAIAHGPDAGRHRPHSPSPSTARAAMPPSRTSTIDPVVIGSQIVTALQSIVARNVDPLKSAVVSVTMFHAGDAFNVIPQTATFTGHGPHARARGAGSRRAAPRRTSQRRRRHARCDGHRQIYIATIPCTSNHARNRPTFATEVARPSGWPGQGQSGHRPGHGRRGFFLHAARRGPAPSSSSAMATRPACIIRPTISTTRRSPSASAIGRDWSRRQCRRLRSGKAWGFAKRKFLARRLAHQRKSPGARSRSGRRRLIRSSYFTDLPRAFRLSSRVTFAVLLLATGLRRWSNSLLAMKSAMRGAISERKREPLKTP